MYPTILHLVVLAIFGSLIVATPIAWGIFVCVWAKRRSRPDRLPGIKVVLAIQAAGMAAIVLVAAFAPVKVEDRERSRIIVLPKQEMTLAELAEPVLHGWNRFYYCYVGIPEGMADHAVRFPSRELSVENFIAAIEAQTPLRHLFRHCGNGYTILWGGDCNFGLLFRTPADFKRPSGLTLQRLRPTATSGIMEVVRGGWAC